MFLLLPDCSPLKIYKIFHSIFFQVHPEQVMGPSQPGSVFLIIECPTVAFIPSLVSNEQLKKYWEGGPNLTPVIIVHLTPMNVFQNEEYKDWMKGLVVFIVVPVMNLFPISL